MKKTKQITRAVLLLLMLSIIGFLLIKNNKSVKENTNLVHELNYKIVRIENLNYTIDSLDNIASSLEILRRITSTMYNPTVEQCDIDPNITADGSIIDIPNASKHKWIAVSRDLLDYNGGPFEYGDVVILIGDNGIIGRYEVHDTMHPIWTRRIDILETFGTRHYKYDDITMVKI